MSPLRIRKSVPLLDKGFRGPDPFAPRQSVGAEFVNALLATALFRCWHIIVAFAGWSTLITVLNDRGHMLNIDSALLTAVGTVLGFVITYRTTSSFQCYSDGRMLWSSIIFGSRNFARMVWFHVPDSEPVEGESLEQIKAKTLVEKKTVINLLEAYAVAVKHYLRGEDSIYYEDLYHHVKFLPAYTLPAGRPSMADHGSSITHDFTMAGAEGGESYRMKQQSCRSPDLPQPVTSPLAQSHAHDRTPDSVNHPRRQTTIVKPKDYHNRQDSKIQHSGDKKRVILPLSEEKNLCPSSMPPKYHLVDLFPFSLLIKFFLERGRSVQGRKAARLRAKMQSMSVSHNLPLEISLYLSSYIAAIQHRQVCDANTISSLLAALNLLVESLTGLERILTTPMPFSYETHLWSVTAIYCTVLPFMTWSTLKWVTIPTTTIITFFYYGFLAAGEEIENPFGYDKNDLNLDHFTNIIREELKAVTSTPPPDPSHWAFVPGNDLVFANNEGDERIPPSEWVKRGPDEILRTLSNW
ncbi:UPF0187-domain-containing protein [Macrolepiota fuliginosa MF-IS2]|uniref:UPF0187-domain-containing protein n=1 Tax=Macrolepiota fuliginosa MF-IS2 TaxID=1400762 RepID=A0A9P5XJS6_9AGAR|nr:UPF0187-domain-containing protein [Macrolepiota fuliginosa MF-IS2]